MKHVLLLLGLVFCMGCETEQDNRQPSRELSEDSKYYTNAVETYTYEGCEYIVVGMPSRYTWGAHKGNCSNPIHNNINK
jgi:hypothetical protein